jgi:hypothetical protein
MIVLLWFHQRAVGVIAIALTSTCCSPRWRRDGAVDR